MPSEFEKGSLLHVVMVLACYAAIAGAVWLGRRGRERAPDLERALRIFWVVFVLLTLVPWQVWQNLPGIGDYRYTLPLHMCDLIIPVIPFALLTRSRFARSVLYFWGVGLTLFALLLPALREGPAQFPFWMFGSGTRRSSAPRSISQPCSATGPRPVTFAPRFSSPAPTLP